LGVPVQDLGFMVYGSRFEVKRAVFRIQGLRAISEFMAKGFGVQGLGFKGMGCKSLDVKGFWVQGVGVQGVGPRPGRRRRSDSRGSALDLSIAWMEEYTDGRINGWTD